ncbi:MAG: ATP-binding protein [Chloroflexi bacterium]|nr:ATP-binding protein [Chloroflexota bacterium]
MKQIGEVTKLIVDATSKASTASSSSTDGPPEPETVCSLCNGIGYLRSGAPIDHPDFGRLIPCRCRLAKIAEQRAATLRSESDLDVLGRMTFDSFVPEGHGLSPDKRANLRWAFEEAVEFAQGPEGWLVLRGGYGCGKTHLAAAIANACIDRGDPVLFTTIPDLLDHLRAAFSPTSDVRYDARFENVRTVPLLILDDLGTESSTPWAQEKLFQIINYRYNARLPTVITTNHELEDIPLRLRSRIVDLGLSKIVSIAAPDYRRAGIDQDQSDLSSLTLHSEQQFETFDLRKGEISQDEYENLARVVQVAQEFARQPRDWLILAGTYGTGKTHIAAAIANQRMAEGHPALFVVVPDLLDHLRASFNPQTLVSFDKRFEQVRRTPLLVLDDLGTESATPWAREKLHQIFDYRYNARLPTVITTATPIEELDPRLATRMLDVSRCTLFAIVAPPYRGGAIQRRSGRRRR